jgi:Tfp pilus assembly protein PilF
MNDVVVTQPRRIVPRWRDFATTAALGEVSSADRIPPADQVDTDIDNVKGLWREFKSPMVAGELLAAGLLEGDWSAVFDAASYLTRNNVSAPGISVDIARRALTWLRTHEAFPVDPKKGQYAEIFDPRVIGAIRRSLRDFQDDPIHWIELALAYAIIGREKKADRAIKVAVRLAPNDRFVLRCASRFLVHDDRPDEAAHLLVRAKRTKTDPWLLAAHLAISEIIDKPARFYRKARETFKSADIPAFHLSELGAALATAELYSGNDKGARRLFGNALVAPTENALAQALWAKNFLAVEVRNRSEVPRSFEANARALVQIEEWNEALKASEAWLQDEPFSARPALLGSAIAATANEDFSKAEMIARRGLVANPTDVGLINNLAFALASANKTEAAAKALAEVRGDPPISQRVALLATSGLIAFRSGDLLLGREKYLQAIRLAKENKLAIHRAIATIFLARESLRTGEPDIDDTVNQVTESLPKVSVPSVNVTLAKLNDELEHKQKEPVQPAYETLQEKPIEVIQFPPKDAPWLRM